MIITGIGITITTITTTTMTIMTIITTIGTKRRPQLTSDKFT
jgi:hypothetical protein